MEDDYTRNFIQDFVQDFSQEIQEPADSVPDAGLLPQDGRREEAPAQEAKPSVRGAGKLVQKTGIPIQEKRDSAQGTRSQGQNEFIYGLIKAAMKARETAYAPYSHYTVGAALLAAGGMIYTGGNIENASYGAANCAERTAIFKAVSEGRKNFLAIAITGGMEGAEPVDYAYPCGICRQVMQEFAGKDFLVIVAKSTDDFRKFRLEDLLPHGFGGESIK